MFDFLGSVTGLLGTLLLWAQFVLGVRPIARRISIDYAQLLRLHTWLGIWGVLLVFTHPIFEMLSYGLSWQFLFVPSFVTEFNTHLAFGQIAFIALIILWLTSAFAAVRKRITYRPWKYIHYLSYPILFLTFLHAREIGSMLVTYPLLMYLWWVLFCSFILMALWRIADALLLTKVRYTLTGVTQVTGDITLYTLTPRTARRITPHIGQYAYVTLRLFGEGHPFTIMEFDNKTGALTFGIKAFGTFTQQLTTHDIGKVVYIDGPYGTFTREGQSAEPKVLIAGGIGVTPFIKLVQEYGDEHTYMFNCNTGIENAIKRDELKAKLGERYVDVIEPERLSPEILTAHVPKEYFSEAKFFICGPQGLMDAAISHLKTLGVHESRIFTEEFSF